MVDLSGFDASQVPEQAEFSAVPEGQYMVMAVASEKKPTKKGDGAYLQICFEVIDGPYKGRKMWSRLNLWNNSKTAVDIANRELGAICRAVNIIIPGDSSKLHDKPLMVTVGVEMDDRKRENNTIKSYDAISSAAPTGFSPAPAAAQQPAAAVVPPWQK
jgi:hypothetical protein